MRPTKEELRSLASDIISEWLGYDSPEPEDPDYGEYELMCSERDAIENLDDFRAFLDGLGKDYEDYEELLSN